ncbi:hypothetical protein [Luteimonas terrae]|uniref:MBL fold metallo-hydrolase n=1 Tax=Luteimonas terrae TaxID=1530191 RepID=A0ABU1XVB8_9GAMM|nr:hypothetical protein [Luteimonas terrae]MDR7192708.1 hypothetical protein [Luteimonas terrae]
MTISSKPHEFSYVYDCGAGGSNDVPDTIKLAERRLGFTARTPKSRKGTVNVLVLSHYDLDHINGARHLVKKRAVERIVLPYLGEDELVVVLSGLALGVSADTIRDLHQLANGAGEFLGRPATLVAAGERSDERTPRPDEGDFRLPDMTRSPDGSPSENMSVGVRVPTADILQLPQSIDDNTEIVAGVPGRSPLWRLRFWNMGKGNLATVASSIKTRLKKIGFPVDALQARSRSKEIVDWLTPIKNRKAAICAYTRAIEALHPGWLREANGRKIANLISIGMYSGPDFPVERSRVHWRHSSLNSHCWSDPFSWDLSKELVPGWIGTGDAPLGQDVVWRDFKQHFSLEMKCYSTFLIPHHGAAPSNGPASYNPGLNWKRGLASVVSYGTRNSYGHPSYAVLARVLDHGGRVIEVNENRETSFHEVMRIRAAVSSISQPPF